MSEKGQHTPGPWEIFGATRIAKPRHGAVAIVAQAGVAGMVSSIREAQVGDDTWDEAMSNASLISSAPEMLYVLRRVAEYAIKDCCPVCNSHPHQELCPLVLVMAKAEGR